MKQILAQLLISLTVSYVFSAEVNWSIRYDGAAITTNMVFDVADGDFNDVLPVGTNFTDASVFGYFRLGIQERVGIELGSNGLVEIGLKITPYDNTGNLLIGLEVTTAIEVDYFVNAGGVHIDASDYRFSGYYKYKVEVLSITGNVDYVYLETGIRAERYYAMNTSFTPSLGVQHIKYSSIGVPTVLGTGSITVTGTEEIYINWDYVDGAEYYDLEWTWVDNYSGTSLSTPIAQSVISMTEQEFRANSTRIRTTDQSYRLPQIFAKGYLIYRVRGVGRWMEDLSKDKYGKWSSGVNTKVNVNDWPNVITISEEHEGLKNWQYQSTYAEEGKKKEVAQYFDGSLRGRQTVTRINSSEQSVVGETVYDNEGRGVIQILPVPQQNPAIRYYEGVNISGVDLPYSHQNFDWESDGASCDAAIPDIVLNTTGAGLYYSVDGHLNDENWQKNVPESHGYPFTQVEYTPDNTGRIRMQSGVGASHTIGSGHETVYYYSQPTQAELNRLFGYKVGYNSRYKKNMVVDANGQVSISYLDAQGRVIATSLAGDNNTAFKSLESEENPTYHQMAYSDFLNKQTPLAVDSPEDNNDLYSTSRFGAVSDGLKLNTQMVVPNDGSTYDFYYKAQSFWHDECESELIYPYVYDLKLSVLDDCGEELLSLNSTLGIENIGQEVGDTEELIDDLFFAKKGTYTVSKSLEINQEALDNYVMHYINPSNNPCLITDFEFEVPDDCNFTSCAECAEGLGTLEEYLIQAQQDEGPEGTYDENYYTQKYDALMNACLEPCKYLTSCDVYHQMLLKDVSPPNGQYALAVSGDPISVITNGYWRDADFAINNTRNYVDEFGNLALVMAYPTTDVVPNVQGNAGYQHQMDDNGAPPAMVEPWQLTLQDFQNYFQPSWAEALIDYHPEYPLYVYATGICTQKAPVPLTPTGSIELSSEEFDAILRDHIRTFVQAGGDNFHDINFLDYTNYAIYDLDPYFAIEYDVHEDIHTLFNHNWKVQLMEDALDDNYKGHGMSMFEFAAQTVLCGNTYTTCGVTIPTSFTDPVFDLLAPEEQDLIWELYKSYYLSLKGQINQLCMDMYGFSQAPGIFNGCIGPGAFNSGAIQSFTYSPLFLSMTNFILVNLWQYDFGTPTGWNPVNHPLISTDPNFEKSMCSSYFDSKEIRITRMAALYNEGSPAEVVIAEGSAQADYAQWQQTGLCPLAVDMERLIKALAVDGQLTTTSSMNQVHEMVPDLYAAIAGAYPSNGSTMDIIGAINGSGEVEITFDYGQTTPDECITIGIPTNSAGSLNWSNYGSSWYITDVSQSYPVPSTTNMQVVIRVITNLLTPNNFVDYVVTYQSCIDLNGCQAEYLADNSNSADCDKEQQFEAALLNVLQKLLLLEELDNSNYTLSSLPEYTQSILVDYLGSSATWNGSTGTIQGSTHNFSLGYSFPSATAMITSLDIFNPDEKVYVSIYTVDNSALDEQMNYSDGYCYNVGIGSCTKIDFSCPCEETQVEEITANIEDLLNELLPIEDPSGLQPQALADMTYLFGGTQQEISNVYNQVDYLREGDLGCLTYSTHWWPVIGEQVEPEAPCLIMEVCDGWLTSTSQIISVSNLVFNPLTQTFTADAYVWVSANQYITVPAEGSIECIVIPDCEPCAPSAIEPVSCTEAYVDYVDAMDDLVGTFDPEVQAEYIMTDSVFCAMSVAYITQAYLYYLGKFSIITVNNEHYLSISEFGATPLGYSNSLLEDAVDAYFASSYDDINSVDYLTWNQYVGTIYMNENPEICPREMPPMTFPDILIEFPCNQWENSVAAVNSQNQQGIYLENKKNEFIQAYIEGAMASVIEQFSETHPDKEYHYTLYYYDRAGNLIQTVPPKGVNRFEYDYTGVLPAIIEDEKVNINGITGSLNTAINTIRSTDPNEIELEHPTIGGQHIAPPHTYVTNYKYNSLNQLVFQVTPDGGESRFAYDKLGRLVISQNALQLSNNQYSYTRYDALGRVTEVGEMTLVGHFINENGRLEDGVGETNAVNAPNFPDNLSSVREEVTRTIYDELPSSLEVVEYTVGTPFDVSVVSLFGSGYQSDNTRNRIVGVIYLAQLNPSDLNDNSDYHNGTFYDYDVHGNVSHMLQINNSPVLISSANQNVKHIEYEYDLVSGNVNKVIYQRDKQDQFIHRYSYDADNRITIAETSNDGFVFEKDAKYFYYDHGPLARTELGEKKVQALDYAYTIQGWLKTVNGEELSPATMMGHDGLSNTLNSQGGRDAFGYSLSYFANDYTSANTGMLDYTLGGTPNLGAGLYNGNIRSMHTALSNNSEVPIGTHQCNYEYDQLNRIKTMQGYNRTVGVNFASSGYSSNYSYDANGNLDSLKRYAFGQTIAMDSFEYHYNANNNQLNWVDDIAGASLFVDDIDNSMDANNYVYDAIGQLIEDVDEGISNIQWTVTNKVKQITKTGEIISFDYDAMGNRIAKHVDDGVYLTSTFYVLDAQGNPMNVYSRNTENNNNLYLSERNMYGSSRLGLEQVYEEMTNADFIYTGLLPNEVGDKRYELSNHLGNVLSVVTDRKLPVELGATGTVDFYTADVVSYSDYYPYGMVMPGRNGNAGDYRYGFQGQEKDDEVSGEGNSYDFGNRMYNPRIGKFLSLDAFASKYPSISPYAFVTNNPISNIEMGGDSVLFYSASGQYLGYSNDNQRYKGKNLLVIIDDKMVDAFNKEYARKRALKEVDGKKISASYTEAIVAGLEAMGTSIDVTDFVEFFNEYRYKKMGSDGKPESLPISDADRNHMELFEWTADIHNKAINSLDKNGSVAANEKTADSQNISDHVVHGNSSVFGFADFHTHSSFNVDPDPSTDDENGADLSGRADWHIVVGVGMFTIFRDRNTKVNPWGSEKDIQSITIYTTGEFTGEKNRKNQ